MTVPYHGSPMSLWTWHAARAAQVVLAVAAICTVAATGLAALGLIPWLALPVTVEGSAAVATGPGLQIGLALFLVTLCGFLPASTRVMHLQMSHRRFQVGMEDVAQAYYAAHAADRQGVFHIANEFDAIRERFTFLRQHPDLNALEPEVLELAAQMSHISRDLARIYSDEKVKAARELLANRGDQATRTEADVDRAMRVTEELARRLAAVEGQEAQATEGISRLRFELDTLLPRLGLAWEPADRAAFSEASSDDGTARDRSSPQPSIAVVRG